MRNEAKQFVERQVKIKDIDMRVGSFVGKLQHKTTGEMKMCDVCGIDEAMWQHSTKKGDKSAYLCFGCGNH